MPKRKAKASEKSPNALAGFWKQLCAHEVQNNYTSTVNNIKAGLVKSIPVSNSYSSIVEGNNSDPYKIVKNIRDTYFERKSRFPSNVFGR